MNKYQYFKSLHFSDEGLFLGGAYDVLSAMVLEKAGFKALGTTSWGVANTFGLRDGERIDFNDYLTIIKRIVNNVTIPVSVDIEAGYGNEDINHILKNVLAVADLGAVGINIEDSLKNKETDRLRDVTQHCDLLSQIRAKLDKNGFKDFFINARTDTYLQQASNPLEETLQRGHRYTQHGADGLFAPGLIKENEIAIITQQIKQPLNILSLPQLTDFNRLKALKVKRFSFGNAFSDRVIAYMEELAGKINHDMNTRALYHHDPLKIQFK